MSHDLGLVCVVNVVTDVAGLLAPPLRNLTGFQMLHYKCPPDVIV